MTWALWLLPACVAISDSAYTDRLDFDDDGHVDHRLGGDDCDDHDAAVWDCPVDPGSDSDSGSDLAPSGVMLPWTTSPSCTTSACYRDASAGYRATCAVRGDGAVLCYGDLPITGLAPTSGAVQVATGKQFACALTDSAGANVTCWGSGSGGSGAPNEHLTLIAAGTDHVCGLRSNGTAICWGDPTGGRTAAPRAEAFVQVDAGEAHSCGLRANGSVLCWGDAIATWGATPGVQGSYLTAGGSSSPADTNCVVNVGGTLPVACWNPAYDVPSTPAIGYERAVRVTSGRLHACALMVNGDVECWGSNSYGAAIAQVATDYIELSVGEQHTCALRADGGVVCWGTAASYQGLPSL